MKRAFTIVEMLIVVTIIAILVALLAPSLRGALDSSRMVSCVNNLKQIGMMFHAYGSDYRSRLPVLFKQGELGDHGDWDSYRAGWYGGEGGTLEWLFAGYGDYDSFTPGRVSGSKVWICPASTIRLVWKNDGEGGLAKGYQYQSQGPNTNAIQGGPLNCYQMANFHIYVKGDGYIPAVFDPQFRGRMRLSYFTSANQPLQYCSARVEMDAYNGFQQGRSNHEHLREGFNAPRPLLYFDGAVRTLRHVAWTAHYQAGLGDATNLHRGAYSGWELRQDNGGGQYGLLPHNYPGGPHKPFHYQVYDP